MSHKNSRLVGFLELIGGLVLLPAWPQIGEVFGMTDYNMYLMGGSLIMTALGMVTADENKTFSPVCWVHAFLTVFFCATLEDLQTIEIFGFVTNPAFLVALFMTYGHLIGRNVGTQEKKFKQN